MEFHSYDGQQSLIASTDFESASSSELSALLSTIDEDPYMGCVPAEAGFRGSSPLGFCDTHQMPDVNPILMYINDLLMMEETGVQRSNSQQQAEGQIPSEDLLKEVDILSLPGDSYEDLFSSFSSLQGPVEGFVPCISNGSLSCEKDEMESWINEIVEATSQAEDQCCLSGPARSAAVSFATSGNVFHELSFMHDSSLQSLEDILDMAITDSVSAFADDFPELGEDQTFNTKTEEAAGKLFEGTTADGEDQTCNTKIEEAARKPSESATADREDQSFNTIMEEAAGKMSESGTAVGEDRSFKTIIEEAARKPSESATPDREDQSFNTIVEEVAGKLSESGSTADGKGRRGWARTETGDAGRGKEQLADGGPMQGTQKEAEQATRERAKQEAKSGGGVGAVKGAAMVVAGAAEEEEGGRGRAAAKKKSGGVRRRRRGEPRLKVAEPTVVDLRALLVNCAQAVSALDTSLARKILNDISRSASPLGSGMQRLAHYFAEGLAARLVGRANAADLATYNQTEAERIFRAYHTFVAVCPFLKLSHFAANDTILNVARGTHRLHILDFNILYGFQWPCFIQALAERAGGPPVLRIVAIDIPLHASTSPASRAASASRLVETGRRLASHANLHGVPFEFQIWERRWQDISAASLRLQPGEVLVVNCIHRLRYLMDETMVAPPANPRKALLTLLRRLNPHLFVEGIVNATYNVPFFLSRFREALFHYSSVFDALDATIRSDLEERLVIEREIMGREILNVVACEGMDRLERPETYRQWQLRTENVGFEMIPLDPLVKWKAKALVQNFYHKDYGVEDDDQGHWLLLGWKGRILHGISTWRPSSSYPLHF